SCGVFQVTHNPLDGCRLHGRRPLRLIQAGRLGRPSSFLIQAPYRTLEWGSSRMVAIVILALTWGVRQARVVPATSGAETIVFPAQAGSVGGGGLGTDTKIPWYPYPDAVH